jgi:hypothetical protein
LGYSVALCILILPLIYYRRKGKKNAAEYLPSDDYGYPRREALRKEWELEYIADRRSAEQHE